MINFFQPQFVFHTPANNHQQNKEYIISRLNHDVATQSDMGNALTTNGQLDLSPFTQTILTDIVWNPFDQMLQELQCAYTPKESKLQSIWWNYYQPGQYTEPHKHIDSDFSGIYLLHLNEPNNTMFYQNGESGSFPLFDEYIHTKDVPEGSTILFPSRLLHWSLPTVKERYVVIFNIVCSV